MLRNVAVAAVLAQTLAWTPAPQSVRRTSLHAEETDALHEAKMLIMRLTEERKAEKKARKKADSDSKS